MTNDEAIHVIMDRFNFAYVHELMETLEWTWDMGGELRLPTEDELRATALRLLEEAVECWDAIAYPCAPRSGGLIASCSGEGRLRLDFSVCSWDAEYGSEED